jgi:hypothetical protein
MPDRWRLRKDEIHGEMRIHNTENYQDGKFFVVEHHAIGVYLHPAKAKMEKAEKEKKDAELRKESDSSAGDQQPAVAEPDNADSDRVVATQPG